MSREWVRVHGVVAALALLIAMRAPAQVAKSDVRMGALIVNVAPTGDVRSIRQALRLVARGGTIMVHAGTYRDSTIVVSIPVRIVGDGDAVLDGENVRQIMTIAADSVTVRGMHFENVGVAFTEDLAAIKVVRASACVIAQNRIDNAFFGIYLQEASGCLIQGNDLHATHARDASQVTGAAGAE